MTGKPTILFICTHNAGRSAIAAALARAHGGELVTPESAGVDRADAASPVTIASLAEIGIDDSGHRPSAISEQRVRQADVVVVMKRGLKLPQMLGVHYETWSLPDPQGWGLNGIRPLRDDIEDRVKKLVARVASRDAR